LTPPSPPSLAEVRQGLAEGVPAGIADEDGARRLWWAALAVLQDDLLSRGCREGVWLASPLPALHEPALLEHLHGWIWTPPGWGQLQPELPAADQGPAGAAPPLTLLPLHPEDGTDPLLMLISPQLQVALALEGPPGARRLLVRFEAPVLAKALQLLGQRLQHDNPGAATTLRHQLDHLGPLASPAGSGEGFWPRLAERLALAAPALTLVSAPDPDESSPQLQLLEALAHEVRTPLATIRTLVRSLLRRSDLPSQVQQRLDQIDAECSEQIDRFGLIFQAAERRRQPVGDLRLARTDLGSLLLQLIPAWERLLARRQLTLAVQRPDPMPEVLSEPALLEKMLTGLMDRFSRSLRRGTRVQVDLQVTGDRLKLRFGSGDGAAADTTLPPPREPVGPVLSWDPTTGSLQLSPGATRDLFARLGGLYTERAGRTLTLYLPVAGNVDGCEESAAPRERPDRKC